MLLWWGEAAVYVLGMSSCWAEAGGHVVGMSCCCVGVKLLSMS